MNLQDMDTMIRRLHAAKLDANDVLVVQAVTTLNEEGQRATIMKVAQRCSTVSLSTALKHINKLVKADVLKKVGQENQRFKALEFSEGYPELLKVLSHV